MQKRIDLGDGSYVMLREKVNVRGRKIMERTSVPALRAMRRIRAARKAQEIGESEEPTEQEMVSYGEGEIEAMQRFEMAGVIAMLAYWTREDPLPRTIEELEELDPDDYEKIAKVVRPELWGLLGRPNIGPDGAVTDDGVIDLDSPTGPSSGSENGSSAGRALPESQLPLPEPETATATSSTGTESSSSEVATPA